MRKRGFMFLLVGAMVFWGLVPAGAYVIHDQYWGGTPTSPLTDRDVIGNPAYFDVDRMEVAFGPDGMVIDIFTSYLDNIGMYGTALGDLFISVDGWRPDGTNPNYAADNFANGEEWEYALVLSNHAPNNETGYSGAASLYRIPQGPSYGSYFRLSYAPSGYGYRRGQEVQFINMTQSMLVNTGSWSINLGASDTDHHLRFVIDHDFGPVSAYGFHWAVTCGNDVIEGGAPVPEPATMLLVGSGLVGLAALGRKRFVKVR